MFTKKFKQIYRKHVRQGAGITKRDLYHSAGKQHSLFFTRDSMLQRQRKKLMMITMPNYEMVKLYRNLYKDSGTYPENMIDPIVRTTDSRELVYSKRLEMPWPSQ